MSAYITRKVADRLVSEFMGKRDDYENTGTHFPLQKCLAVSGTKFMTG